MCIYNAVKLLKAVDDDSELREGLYVSKGAYQVMTFLKSKGYDFDLNELEDAISHLHSKCQTLESAQSLLHKAEWLKYLLH